MFAILGIVLVFGAVIGGFLMEKGHIEVLLQPAELLIIAGRGNRHASGGESHAHSERNCRRLDGRSEGIAVQQGALSEHAEDDVPVSEQGAQRGSAERGDGRGKAGRELDLQELSRVSGDHHACDFVCDTLRMAITGGVEPFDMDQMMELDMEVHHHDAMQPIARCRRSPTRCRGWASWRRCSAWSSPWARWADRRRRSAIKVAAALVGTFLGILLCYGVVGPLSSNMSKTAEDQNELSACAARAAACRF